MKSARRLMTIAVTVTLLSAGAYALWMRRTTAAETDCCCEDEDCC